MASVQKNVITAETVRQIAVGGVLPVPRGVIITPLARDMAAERKLRLVADGDGASSKLPATGGAGASEDLIRSVVQQVLQARSSGQDAAAGSRARRFPLQAAADSWSRGGAADDVHLAELVDEQVQGGRMRAGYVSLSCSGQSVRQGLELLVVLEGVLQLGDANGSMTAYPGDLLLVPDSLSLTASTPSWARFAYMRTGAS